MLYCRFLLHPGPQSSQATHIDLSRIFDRFWEFLRIVSTLCATNLDELDRLLRLELRDPDDWLLDLELAELELLEDERLKWINDFLTASDSVKHFQKNR